MTGPYQIQEEGESTLVSMGWGTDLDYDGPMHGHSLGQCPTAFTCRSQGPPGQTLCSLHGNGTEPGRPDLVSPFSHPSS